MGYDENYTCKYVYAHSGTNTFTTDGQKIIVNLPPCVERTPNMKIKLVAASFGDDQQYSGLVIRMDQTPSEFFSNDNLGAVLGVMGDMVTYQIGGSAAFDYKMIDPTNSPEYVISSSQRVIEVGIEDNNGSALTLSAFDEGMALVFKLSYPRQPDEIQQQFSAQIHRGLN